MPEVRITDIPGVYRYLDGTISPKNITHCDLCGAGCHWYMLRKYLWLAVISAIGFRLKERDYSPQYLCLLCVEKFMARKLKPEDFTMLPQ